MNFWNMQKFFKNFYGTTNQIFFEELKKEIIIFDIDWRGTNQIISQKLKNRLLTFLFLHQAEKNCQETFKQGH